MSDEAVSVQASVESAVRLNLSLKLSASLEDGFGKCFVWLTLDLERTQTMLNF